jgi:hypothetical protein
VEVLRSSSPADAADDYYAENDAAAASDNAAGSSSVNMQPQPLGGTKRQRSLSGGSRSNSLQRHSKRAASTELLRSVSSSSTGSSSGARGLPLEPVATAAAVAAAVAAAAVAATTVAGRAPRAQSDGSSSGRPGVLIPFHEKHARKLARAAARAAAGHSVRRRSSSSGKRGKQQQQQQRRSGSAAGGSSSRSGGGAAGSRTVSSSGRSGAPVRTGGLLSRSGSSGSAVVPAAAALADDSATEVDDDGYSSSSSVKSTDGFLSADDVAAAEAGSSRRHDRPMQQRRSVRQPAPLPVVAAAAAAARVDSLVEDLLQRSDLLAWGQQRYTLLGLDSNTTATAPAAVCTAVQEHRYYCDCGTEIADVSNSAGHSADCHLALLRQLLNSVSLWSQHCSDAPNVQAHSELAAVTELIRLLLGSTLGATAATAGAGAVAEECVAAVCAALQSLNILGGLRDAWHAADSDVYAAQHSFSSSSSTAGSQALLQLYTALACHLLDWTDRVAAACRTLTAASSAGALECCATLTSSLLLLLLQLWPFDRAVWHSAAPQQRAQVRAALPLLPLWLKLMRVCDSIADSCTTTAMPAAGGSAVAALCKGGFWGLLRAMFTQRYIPEVVMPAEMCWRVLLEALRMSLLSPTGSTSSSVSNSSNEQWQCVAALLQASAAPPAVAARTAAATATAVQAPAHRQLPPCYACVLFKRMLLLHRCWRTVPDPALKASLWAIAHSTTVAAAAAAETAAAVGLRHGIPHSDADDALLIRALRGAVREGSVQQQQQQQAWGNVVSRAVQACCLAAQTAYCLPAAALTGM